MSITFHPQSFNPQSFNRGRFGRRLALVAVTATMVAGVSAAPAHADRSPRPPAPAPGPVVVAAPTTTVPPTTVPPTAPPTAAPAPMVITAPPVVEPTPTIPPVLAPAPTTVPTPAAPTPAGPAVLGIEVTDSGYSISDVSVTPHGTWAKIRWTTNAPKSTLFITDQQPQFVNGVWTHWSEDIVGVEHFGAPGNLTFKKKLLNPNTKYWYIITAETSGFDKPVQVVGSFTTLTRTVTVHIDGIHVTDDGDPGLKGAGDFTFWFHENGNEWTTFSKGIKSDSSVGLDLTLEYKDVRGDEDMQWDVQVFEDDRQSWDKYCGDGVLPGQSWSGEGVNVDNACGTWLTMGLWFDASPGIYGPGNGEFETQPVEFTMSPWDSSVHMTITGKIVSTFD
jgi:hypothetical protein